MLRVTTKDQTVDVRAGESAVVEKGEWVQYSGPTEEGAEYISVCVPAFSPETVHRDER
jgi:mannose-6-phosphate isomerase-like protein (cupin superfamily)